MHENYLNLFIHHKQEILDSHSNFNHLDISYYTSQTIKINHNDPNQIAFGNFQNFHKDIPRFLYINEITDPQYSETIMWFSPLTYDMFYKPIREYKTPHYIRIGILRKYYTNGYSSLTNVEKRYILNFLKKYWSREHQETDNDLRHRIGNCNDLNCACQIRRSYLKDTRNGDFTDPKRFVRYYCTVFDKVLELLKIHNNHYSDKRLQTIVTIFYIDVPNTQHYEGAQFEALLDLNLTINDQSYLENDFTPDFKNKLNFNYILQKENTTIEKYLYNYRVFINPNAGTFVSFSDTNIIHRRANEIYLTGDAQPNQKRHFFAVGMLGYQEPNAKYNTLNQLINTPNFELWHDFVRNHGSKGLQWTEIFGTNHTHSTFFTECRDTLNGQNPNQFQNYNNMIYNFQNLINTNGNIINFIRRNQPFTENIANSVSGYNNYITVIPIQQQQQGGKDDVKKKFDKNIKINLNSKKNTMKLFQKDNMKSNKTKNLFNRITDKELKLSNLKNTYLGLIELYNSYKECESILNCIKKIKLYNRDLKKFMFIYPKPKQVYKFCQEKIKKLKSEKNIDMLDKEYSKKLHNINKMLRKNKTFNYEIFGY